MKPISKRNPNKEINWEVLDANETYLLQALEVKSLVQFVTRNRSFIPKKEIVKTVKALIDEQLILIDEKSTKNIKPKK